jgi:hypothetical protein
VCGPSCEAVECRRSRCTGLALSRGVCLCALSLPYRGVRVASGQLHGVFGVPRCTDPDGRTCLFYHEIENVVRPAPALAPQWSLLCCAAVRCRALPCAAVRCRALPCAAVRCRALPCAAVCCRALPCAAVRCRALPCASVRCRALPCAAVRCRALPCAAVRCRVLPCACVPLRGV